MTQSKSLTKVVAMENIRNGSINYPDLDSQTLLEAYNKNGYVIVRGLLKEKTDIKPVVNEYDNLFKKLCKKWYREGRISSDLSVLPFEQRALAIAGEGAIHDLYNYLRIFFNPPKGIDEHSPIHVGPAVLGLVSNKKLLDVIETFIGKEIYFNPVSIVRFKPPERLFIENLRRPDGSSRSTGGISSQFWHQDQAVFAKNTTDIDMLTVWISLTDATKEMGCLIISPGTHLEGLAVHCAKAGKAGIPEIELEGTRTFLETEAGDVVFMNKLLKHGSLSNVSDRLRFSFDLRYQPNLSSEGKRFLGSKGFVVRSAENPEQVIDTSKKWYELQESNRRFLMNMNLDTEPSMQNHFDNDHEWCF